MADESKTRRANGEGSIFKSETDGLWHAFVTMGVKDDGSPDRRHRKGKNRADVVRKVKELEQERASGHVTKAGRVPTVGEWVAYCVTEVMAPDLAPRTVQSYLSDVRNWIIPGLGAHRLDRLRPEHLDALYARMRREGKAASHILKVHRILSRTLVIAVRRGKLAVNVTTLMDAPSAPHTEIKPLSKEDTDKLLAAARQRPTGARWAVGLALGLRQGEAIGLRWEYLDLDAGAAHIHWQISREPWKHGCKDVTACTAGRHKHACPKDCPKAARTSGRKHVCTAKDAKGLCKKDCKRHASTCPQRHGGGLVFRRPKGKSKRTVPIPPQLVAILKAHRKAQLKQRLRLGESWKETDLVFCRPDGSAQDPRQDFDDWKDLLKTADVRDARLHDGRHTAATLLLEQGVDVRVVQEVLGHSDLRLTARYAHVASPMATDAMGRLGDALWGAGS